MADLMSDLLALAHAPGGVLYVLAKLHGLDPTRLSRLVLATLTERRRRGAELVGLCLTSWCYAAALGTRGLYW